MRRKPSREQQPATEAADTHGRGLKCKQASEPVPPRKPLSPLTVLLLAVCAVCVVLAFLPVVQTVPVLPTPTDYYEVLGVAPDATQAELKQAFHKLSLANHPDKNKNDPDAERRFVEIAEAYEVLSNEEKRLMYDHQGHHGLHGSGLHSPFDIFDGMQLFERHFTGNGMEVEIIVGGGPIDIEDVLGDLLGGVGGHPHGLFGDVFEGGKYGSHEVLLRVNVPLAVMFTGGSVQLGHHNVEVLRKEFSFWCDRACADVGTHAGLAEECKRCANRPSVDPQIPLQVPPLSCHGDYLELPRNVYSTPVHVVEVVVEAMADPSFHLDSSDLVTRHHIHLHEALLGFSHRITLLDGTEVSVEGEGITRPGTTKVFPGKGWGYCKDHDYFGWGFHDTPSSKHSFRGVLRVDLDIVFPESLDELRADLCV